MANIFGLMDVVLKVTLSKVIEMAMVHGNQKVELKIIKGIIYQIVSMVLVFIVGAMELFIKDNIFRIYVQGTENFIRMVNQFMMDNGRMDKELIFT